MTDNRTMSNQLRTLAEAEAAKAVPPDEMPTVDGHFIDWMKSDRERFAAGFIAGRTSVTREQIVRVLRRHELGAPNGGTASWAWCKCSCGRDVRLAGMTRGYVFQLAEDHRADQVLALLNGESDDY